ncbi:hypothetical protein NFI96_026639 [Prochilodus magdalenae]|nr:hypothetical protein NFI96_026639 [Prochilodus magdalenae]
MFDGKGELQFAAVSTLPPTFASLSKFLTKLVVYSNCSSLMKTTTVSIYTLRLYKDFMKERIINKTTALSSAVTEVWVPRHVPSIMKLFTPVLLLLALSGCSSEVVHDFKDKCPEFFANPKGDVSPPTVFPGPNYKPICQVRENEPEYATLYDMDKKIPVYSAYKFKGWVPCTRKDKWYIEPQLENSNNDPNMELESSLSQIHNQAVNSDYDKSSYARGHLASIYIAQTNRCSDATFTLTNAAPRDISSDRVQWKRTERIVAEALDRKCKGNVGYVVTGAVPGSRVLRNHVSIPSHFWTAYCCLDSNLHVRASRGYIAFNENIPSVEMSVSMMDRILTDLYGHGNFTVFHGQCDQSTPVDLKWIKLQTECCQHKVLDASKKRCVEGILDLMYESQVFHHKVPLTRDGKCHVA